jgi:hypothetical protein
MVDPLEVIEREILLILLEKTKDKPFLKEELNDVLHVTADTFDSFIDSLLEKDAIKLEGDLISADLNQRLGLAVKAIRAGADFERVSKTLGWLEFEELVAYTFEENGYVVSKRFRFQADSRRWEIDVLAKRYPLVICAECKHWSRGLGNTSARKIVESHLEKVKILSENAPKLHERLKLTDWNHAVFIPVALSLQPARYKIYRRIPVVSVFELPRFLSEFEGQMDWLYKFNVKLPQQTKMKLRQIKLRK